MKYTFTIQMSCGGDKAVRSEETDVDVEAAVHDEPQPNEDEEVCSSNKNHN